MAGEEKLIKTYFNGRYELRSQIEVVPLNQNKVLRESQCKSLRDFTSTMFGFSAIGIISLLVVFCNDPQSLARGFGFSTVTMALLIPAYDVGLLFLLSICIAICVWRLTSPNKFIYNNGSPEVQQYEIILSVHKQGVQNTFENIWNLGYRFKFNANDEESGKQKIKDGVNAIDRTLQRIVLMQETQNHMEAVHNNLIAYAANRKPVTDNRFLDIDISMEHDE